MNSLDQFADMEFSKHDEIPEVFKTFVKLLSSQRNVPTALK